MSSLSNRDRFAYLFFLRFPILLGAAILLMPALGTWIPDLLTLSGWRIAVVTFFALAACWACMLGAMALIEAAPRRHSVAPLPIAHWIFIGRFALCGLLALPIVCSILLEAGDKRTASVMVAAGCVAAAAVVWLVTRVRTWLIASDASLPPRARKIRRMLGGRARDEQGRQINSFLFMLIFLFAVVSMSCVVANWRAAASIRHDQYYNLMPSLAYLEVLIIQWALLLAILSLYLDHYHVPVLLVVLLWLIGVSLVVSGTRHHFIITRAACPDTQSDRNGGKCSRPVPIETALDAWLQRAERRGARKPVLLVVSVSGGGIHSAAWSTRVLTGLQQEFGSDFTRSIRLFSSASGGSLGVLYFVASYDQGLGAPAAEQLDYINMAAGNSADDSVAWGLMRVNLVHLCFPLFDEISDRGRAMEETWSHSLLWKGQPYEISDRLSQWREGVRQGWRPGTVFNATLVETNQPILFSTVELPASGKGVLFGEGAEGYSGADIEVVTAVRLSASFAWVSPMANAHYADSRGGDAKLSRLHIGDAGYYDAYGVESAVDWSLAVMQKYRERLDKIVIIQIRDEPYTAPDAPSIRYVQLTGPIVTSLDELLRIQYQRNQESLARARDLSRGFIDTVVFAPNDVSTKSWALSRAERAGIESDWQQLRHGDQMNKLRELWGQTAVNASR